MQSLKELQALAVETVEDGAKFEDKGNDAAGARVRKDMLEIGKLAHQIRKEIQATRNERKAAKIKPAPAVVAPVVPEPIVAPVIELSQENG